MTTEILAQNRQPVKQNREQKCPEKVALSARKGSVAYLVTALGKPTQREKQTSQK